MKTEDVKTLFEKAFAHAKKANGQEPDSISIHPDGSLEATFSYIACGEIEYEHLTINVEDLN